MLLNDLFTVPVQDDNNIDPTHIDTLDFVVGEIQKELKNLIHECADKNGLSIIAIETDIDHVHVFVSASPRYSPAWIANLLKGYTSRMLRLKFPFLKRKCGRDKL